MPALLKELYAAYGRTGLVRLVTTDAGNTSLRVAGQMVGLKWNYFSQIKSEHGEIHREAERALGRRKTCTADFSYAERQKGDRVTYHVWQYDLSEDGWLDWTHARQLVRVQRTVEDASGKQTIGNRFYVSSLTIAELGPTNAATISRGHWRCEEETHWTSDAQLNEDLCRLSWSRHPNGVFVAHAVRMIGLSILAVARKLTRLGYTKATPTWRQVAEHFLLVLCASTLQTSKFDAPSES
jgi:predicted transposase YbfD/YdcC